MPKYEIIPNPEAPSLVVFEEDFDQIALVFKDILADASWSALPGGVWDTYVPEAKQYQPISLSANDFRGYRMDAGTYLGDAKRVLSEAIIAVEGANLCHCDNFTICPSVSFALLTCLLALKRMGIGSVLLEAPGYYATVEQAHALGLAIYLLPGSPTNGFRVTADHVTQACKEVPGRCVLVVTQPRYGTGENRVASEISKLRSQMRPGDVILVDEAADQTVPAPMGQVPLEGDVLVLRVRGLTKGLGLNSARMATVIHPRDLREAFGDIVDYAGGNLDSASLQMMLGIASNPQFYIAQLRAAQQFVHDQWETFGRNLRGLPIRLSPIESGYFATAHIDTGVPPADFEAWRRQFLQACLKYRMPVVLGSSMYFPYDLTTEIVRINYFSEPNNLRKAAQLLPKILDEVRRSP